MIISSHGIIYKILKKIWEKAYCRADRLIVCGRDMRAVLCHKFEKYKRIPEIAVIENWADKNITQSNENLRNDNRIEVLFAGNIGRCQGIEAFLNLIKEGDIDNLSFKFRGDGACVPFIKEFIANNPKLNVEYGGKYSRDEQFSLLEKCDLALVTLADGMYGLGVPSKSYNIMAAGKPILYIGDKNSEIAMVVREYEIGYCFEPADMDGLTMWLKSINHSIREEFQIKGLKARRLAESIFSEDTILDKYSNLFA